MEVALTAPPPRGLTVRKATLLQLTGPLEAQARRREGYVRSALLASGSSAPTEESVAAACQQLATSLGLLWRLPWENQRKEILWRLTVNGVPAAGGHDLSPTKPCLCGWPGPDAAAAMDAEQRASQLRLHCFWQCPLACAVSSELASALPQPVQLTCADVWLLQSPSSCVLHPMVWCLVCMVALEAMAHGRKALWAMHAALAPAKAEGQQLITDFFHPTGDSPTTRLLQRACRKARARFWSLLQDFVVIGQADWMHELEDSHPFLGFRAGKLCLNLPPGAALPSDI